MAAFYDCINPAKSLSLHIGRETKAYFILKKETTYMKTHFTDMKTHLTVFMLSIFTFTALPLQAEKIPVDTLLAHLYNRAADLMEEGEYEEAQLAFDSAFATRGVEQSPVYPVLLNEQGTLFVYVGKMKEAMEMKKHTLRYLPRVDDLEKHISVYTDLAILYRREHHNDSAFHYYGKALDAAMKYGDDGWIAHIYNNIMVLHFNLRQLNESEQFADLALPYAQKSDDIFVTFTTHQLRAAIKNEIGKTEEAEESIRKAWGIACQAEGNADVRKMQCLPSLLKIFQKQEKTDSIDHYLKLGDELLERVPATTVPGTGYLQARAAAEMTRHNYARALDDLTWLRRRNIGSEPNLTLTGMAQCLAKLGNHRQAYLYMDSARMETDTLAQRNLTAQMAEFNVKYRTQEKELEIARLNQKNLEHEAFRFKMILVTAILAGIALVIMIILRHKKRMAEKKIELLKQENELNSARRYIEGLEEECKHFAKELHDGIANDLLGLQMKIETSTGKENKQELASLVGQLRNNVRNISHELMPPEFEYLSLQQILIGYAGKLAENSGTSVNYHPMKDDTSRLLPTETAYELYRIVQELTMNIVKHADADRIDISLRMDNEKECTLQITDNGHIENDSWNGSNAAITESSPNDGIGLRTVNDRIKAINATSHTCTEAGSHTFTLLFNMDHDNNQ